MTDFALTFREDHLSALRNWLLLADQKERVAYVFLRRSQIVRDCWTHSRKINFLSNEVIGLRDDELISFSSTHVTWHTNSVVQALKKAHAMGAVLAVVHSHPLGGARFSAQDDDNEADLIQLAQNRNGPETQLLSILITPDESPVARLWRSRSEKYDLAIRVIGNRFRFYYPERRPAATLGAFHRQSLAFGDSLTQDLRTLRIAIVGCGGTGSAVAMLLARLGVGQLVLFDRDTVEESNLNRLHGAGIRDAIAKRPKTAVIHRMIVSMGLGTSVREVRRWVGDSRCRDILKSCDIIFGCTDDHEGRLLLNRFAYFYLVPVIDLGLAIEVTKGPNPKVQALDGRVTVLIPPNTCLLCRDVIDPRRALAESLKRANPAEYERRKAEAYVLGEGDPNPAVVTFTTEVATMAVNELLHRLTGFRGDGGESAQRVRLFHRMHDLRPSASPRDHCPVCGSEANWAIGDFEPFLGRVG